ncbi:unnamed protein product [Brachionus calyciflorus]|uniref:HTH CENPB-type domain-containing protein n=1 Tax=Brachionus calyciflorus TaxID=104777 RepID=A0A814QD41_9BILA|nr:unnamed protein product [Brachionus calyciflorus]
MARKTSYPIAFKLKVIREFDILKSKRKVAQKYSIPRKAVREWIQDRENLESSPDQITRRRIAPTVGDYPELESQLFNWIVERRVQGVCLQGYHIQDFALSLKRELNLNPSFNASRGWLYRFLKRHNLVLRRVSTTGKDLPKNVKDIVSNYICSCQDISKEMAEKYGDSFRKYFFNMDETAIRLDDPGNYTYDVCGSQRIKATTSGHEMNKVSIAFCATANGEKLPALIMVPRQTPLNDFVAPANVIVVYKNSATFDGIAIRDYFLKRVLFPHMDRNGMGEACLIWDNAPCHNKDIVLTSAVSKNLRLLKVPPRMTNLVQPADISWFRPLKSKFNRYWTNWFINEEHSYTAKGNMRSPGYACVINWVSEIWKDMDPNLLRDSFEHCGLVDNSNLHSVLNKLIHEDIILNEILEDSDLSSNTDNVFLQENDFFEEEN